MSGVAISTGTDVTEVIIDGVTEYSGTMVNINAESGNAYFTVNISDYQKYSVAKELFEFGASTLSDTAYPLYEFKIDSANFLFLEKFAPFRDSLELGKGVHLGLGSMGHITPNIIGVEFDFENTSSFVLTFSNQFRLKNGVESLADMINGAYSSTRSFDSSKYIYNKAADQATIVSKYMNSTLDAAVQTILGSSNQSVIINGAGIQVGGEDSKYKIRIVDNMIAMSDDDWETAKLAIGRFASEDVGEVWGVNAELVAGKLLIGNTLILENPLYDEENNPTGTMQFKVDSTGAWLYNSRIVLQTDSPSVVSEEGESDESESISTSGGLMILDPSYGIVAGNSLLFDTKGTTVTPEFLDEYGDIELDKDGMPENANFYLDIRNGNAYIRGTIYGTAGEIGGWTLAEDFLHTGSGGNYVAINGSGTNTNSEYAFWAGNETPAEAPFWVKKDGSMSATNGTFTGVLSAAKVSGALMSADGDSWLVGCGIAVGQSGEAAEYTKENYNFFVDAEGNVNIKNGSISFSSLDSDAQTKIENAANAAGAAADAAEDVRMLAIGKYHPEIAIENNENTFIDGKTIWAPYISGGTMYGGEFIATGKGRYYGNTEGKDYAAYYIYDNNTMKGYISYDDGGAGTVTEASERVFFTTTKGTAMKIYSGAGLSMEAENGIHLDAYLAANKYVVVEDKAYLSVKGAFIGGYDTVYGATLPETATSTGQIFFKLAQ